MNKEDIKAQIKEIKDCIESIDEVADVLHSFSFLMDEGVNGNCATSALNLDISQHYLNAHMDVLQRELLEKELKNHE